MTNIKKTVLIITIILALPVSCAIFSEKRIDLADKMPRETDVPGWTTARPFQTLEGRDIKIINPVYRSAGASQYSELAYRSISDPEKEVQIAVITFENPLDAYGMFSMERGFIAEDKMETPFLYITEKSVYTIKHNYYIKVISTHEDESVFLRSIADHITNRLPGERKPGAVLPDYINAITGNIKNSDLVYYPVSHDLLQEISGYFVRQKRYSGRNHLVFFARAGSHQASINRYYNPILKGDRFTLYRTEPAKMLYNRSEYKGEEQTALVSIYGNWFVGIAKADTLEEAVTTVSSIFQRIDEFEAVAR